MAINQDNRVIHRFIRNISDYESGGEFYAQIIPLDTQAYAIYPNKDGNKLFYVIGDGEHTYTEIRDGLGNGESHKEYPVFTESNLHDIKNGIEEEAEARRQADKVLQSNIDQEASERERFDNLLDETLCEEILIRTSADETLSQNISNETAAREAGDEVLQGRISDEEARALEAETVLQSTKQDVLTAGTNIEITNNVISTTSTMLHKVLNTVVQVSSFVSDDTYEGYLYRVDIPVAGITANHVPYVMLSITDSISANYSTFVESGDGYVSMWSKALPESAITIPVITYE